MKKIFFSSILLCMAIAGFSQQQIALEDTKNHVNDSVIVCGKVFTARYLETAKNSPTFLNMGAAYPNQLLTVVIWEDVRKQLTGKPEEIFLNKDICVTGKVELFKDKPQIVIRTAAQVKLKE